VHYDAALARPYFRYYSSGVELLLAVYFAPVDSLFISYDATIFTAAIERRSADSSWRCRWQYNTMELQRLCC
jgi:hypothetical protein